MNRVTKTTTSWDVGVRVDAECTRREAVVLELFLHDEDGVVSTLKVELDSSEADQMGRALLDRAADVRLDQQVDRIARKAGQVGKIGCLVLALGLCQPSCAREGLGLDSAVQQGSQPGPATTDAAESPADLPEREAVDQLQDPSTIYPSDSRDRGAAVDASPEIDGVSRADSLADRGIAVDLSEAFDASPEVDEGSSADTRPSLPDASKDLAGLPDLPKICPPLCSEGCGIGCSPDGTCRSCATCTCEVASGVCHC